MKSSITNPSIT